MFASSLVLCLTLDSRATPEWNCMKKRNCLIRTLWNFSWLLFLLIGSVLFFMIFLTRFACKSKSLNFICKRNNEMKKGRSSTKQQINKSLCSRDWNYSHSASMRRAKNCIIRLNVSRELVCPKLIGKFHIAASLTCLERRIIFCNIVTRFQFH